METVIFANGIIQDYDTLSLIIHDAVIIAANGGLKHVREMGLVPDLVIGDVDSITADDLDWLRTQRVEVIKHAREKDETDLELAFLEAVRRKAENILVAGAMGGRIDQALANISLLMLPELEGIPVVYDDGREEILVIRNKSIVGGSRGDTVSLIPLFGAAEEVTTEGLKYPLSEETLYPERTRGISNIMLEDKATIRVGKGSLLCIHMRDSNVELEDQKEKSNT